MSDRIAQSHSSTSGCFASTPGRGRHMMPIDSVIADLVRYLSEAAAVESDPVRAQRLGRTQAQILDCQACNRSPSPQRCDLCVHLDAGRFGEH